jgi:serine/threonine-protein kinase
MFLDNLRESGLLDPEQLAAAAAAAPEVNRGRVLARRLVQKGWLTGFQAAQVLAGRTQGFLLGPYRILDQLGQGGMGRVYKAEHRAMGRIVAIKVLAPHLLKTPKARDLFLREVRALARLVHPNIVTAFDANQEGERHYLVLEYVDGPNLEQLVRDRGPLPVGLACEVIRQVALGLQHAHELGMVHRDIKPANILVQLKSVGDRLQLADVKISDFGLARLHAPGSVEADRAGTIMARAHTVMGTPDYLSPEQARNMHKVDIRSDLYSLGCTLYHLLTGQVPFPGGTTLEKLVRHGLEEPEPLEKLRSRVPAAVAAIVRRLMAKAPAARFQTPAELAAALKPFAAEDPTPWAGSPAAASTNDPGITPLDPDSDADLDNSGLANTLALDQSLTPLSAEGLPAAGRLLVPRLDAQRRRLKIALLSGVGVVGGLLALLLLVNALR